MKSLVSCMNHEICDIRNVHTDFNMYYPYFICIKVNYEYILLTNVQLNFRCNDQVQNSIKDKRNFKFLSYFENSVKKL